MDPEGEKAQGKPVLNAQSFQRLLAAAYTLQVYSDLRSPVRPSDAGGAPPFAAGAIVQSRTPSSAMIREPQVQAGRSDSVPVTQIRTEIGMGKERPGPGRLLRLAEPTVPGKVTLLLVEAMSWRTVEALAIAVVFCMMMGLSIHRLSALPGSASLSSGMTEQPNGSQPARPTAMVSASDPQPVVTRRSRPSHHGNEADMVAENIVIHYQNRALNLVGQTANKPARSATQAQLLPPENTASKPGIRFTFGRDAGMLAADTEVRYGDDVTMWSRKPKRAALDRLSR